jgi:hypothetical protein
MTPEVRQRIESQRIAFITQRVHLTPDEATKFWPVYNEYRDALKDMRDDFERPISKIFLTKKHQGNR